MIYMLSTSTSKNNFSNMNINLSGLYSNVSKGYLLYSGLFLFIVFKHPKHAPIFIKK